MDNLIMADVIPATFLTLPYTVPDSQTLLKIMEQSYWWHLSCISIICHISVSFVNSSSPFPIIIIIIIMYYQVQFAPCQAKEARLSTAVFVQVQYKPFSSMYLCLTSLHRCQCTAAFVQLQYKISSTCAWLARVPTFVQDLDTCAIMIWRGRSATEEASEVKVRVLECLCDYSLKVQDWILVQVLVEWSEGAGFRSQYLCNYNLKVQKCNCNYNFRSAAEGASEAKVQVRQIGNEQPAPAALIPSSFIQFFLIITDFVRYIIFTCILLVSCMYVAWGSHSCEFWPKVIQCVCLHKMSASCQPAVAAMVVVGHLQAALS